MTRMNSRDRPKWYKYLAQLDGEKCYICGVRGTKETLVVDHWNNDNSDNRPENLHLLCRSCNTSKNVKNKAVDNMCVSVCEDERPLPPEMAHNLRTEPRFRRWLLVKVLELEKISYEEALNAGAEYAGASTETVRRYLRKVTSSEGIYVILNDPDGYPYIHFKNLS